MGIARVGMNFTIDILKKKAATMVTIVDSNSFPQVVGLSTLGKSAAFKEDLKK